MTFVVIIVLAVIVRGAVILVNLDQFAQDPDAYRVIAETLSETGTFGLPTANELPAASDTNVHPIGTTARATAFRPPLYPYLLSWLTTNHTLHHSLVGVLHLALGVLTTVCTLSIASQLIDRGRIGWASILAALIVLIDPILLQQSTLVMTETIATATATLLVWYWVSRLTVSPNLTKGLIFGGLLGLAYYCRPTFLAWAALLLPAILLGIQGRWKERIAVTVATASVIALAVGFWTLRNLNAIGHPVWGTSHGGYTLLLANNPSFYDYLRNGKFGEAWDAEPFLEAYEHRFQGDPNTAAFWQTDWSRPEHAALPARVLSEHEDDQLAYHAAKATIARQPAMFVWSCVVRLARLWSPMPHHVPGRSWPPIILVTVYYGVFSIAVILGCVRLGRSILGPGWWAIGALVLTLSAVHTIYWSNLRMRSPAIPSLAVVAAAALRRPDAE
ncbi:hypothetical protein [Novipirellula galeiformis]|nr:hypothetical protein [Novipirellula galeiformis]